MGCQKNKIYSYSSTTVDHWIRKGMGTPFSYYCVVPSVLSLPFSCILQYTYTFFTNHAHTKDINYSACAMQSGHSQTSSSGGSSARAEHSSRDV